jgi:hypothetical protein
MLFSALLLLAHTLAPSGARSEQAKRAFDFVNMVGVAGHQQIDKSSGPVFAKTIYPFFEDTKIRHYRTGIRANQSNDNPNMVFELRQLQRDLGVKICGSAGSPATFPSRIVDDLKIQYIEPAKIDGTPVSGAFKLANVLTFLEGPNEPGASEPDADYRWETYISEDGLFSAGGDWRKGVTIYQDEMWTKTMGDPNTSHIKLVQFALSGGGLRSSAPVFKNLTVTGDSNPDYYCRYHFANGHPYPPYGHAPDRFLDADVTAPNLNPQSNNSPKGNYLFHYRTMTPTQSNIPLVATECGYHPGKNYPTVGVPDVVSERYIVRQLLEMFNRGFKHVWLYQIYNDKKDDPLTAADESLWFGLLGQPDPNTGIASPTPAYWPVRNLVRLLDDAGNNNFITGSLNYSTNPPVIDDFTATNTELHHTLLQKKNGKFYLVLWQSNPCYAETGNKEPTYDPDTGAPVGYTAVPNRSVNVTIATPITALRLHNMVTGTITTPTLTTVTGGKRLNVNVPDFPVVLEITPQ